MRSQKNPVLTEAQFGLQKAPRVRPLGLSSFLASVRGVLRLPLPRTASDLLSNLDLEITPRRALSPSSLVFCSLSRRAGREHGSLVNSDAPPLALRHAW